MAQTSPFLAAPVWVILMNFACTGLKVTIVMGVSPAFCATGVPHVLPSVDSRRV